MKRCLRILPLLVLVLLPGVAWGDRVTNNGERALELRDTPLTESQRTQRAEAWGLRVEEWERYETLMQEQRGLWSPNLDPIMVLGIHARSEEERRRYAELAVEQERARVEAELAFQRAYDDAWRRLYPNELLIDLSRLSRGQSQAAAEVPAQASVVDIPPRLLWFTRTEDCPACDELLPSVLDRARELSVGLDIFLVDTQPDEDDAIRAWAREQGIPVERVRTRQITLNHDQGTAARLGIWQSPPVLAIATSGGTRAITLTDLR